MYGQGLRLEYPRLYRFWAQMKNKCSNPHNCVYKNFGARGIKVCEDWSKFENFKIWALENGYEDSKFINRVDINKDFTPDNCIIENIKIYNSKSVRGEKSKYKRERLYGIWVGMIRRCTKSTDKAYKNYGGRGIKICKEWLNSFDNFKNWAQKEGYKDNLTIDRIDVNGNYEPSNCRWADMLTQQNNRRNNHRVEYKGKSYTIAELSREYNIPYDKLHARLFMYPFWDIERALTTH